MIEKSTPETAAGIIDAIGRATLAKHLNVKLTAISNAYVAGSFPASWFGETEALCRAAGIECPRRLFRFRSADLSGQETAA